MSTCDNHDFVVVYEGRYCPVCELDQKIDALEQEVVNLEEERDNLTDERDDLLEELKR
jgi:predicted  nucleic acid-binding Zn-ribbon protein